MGLLRGLPSLRRALADPDLALDLGTANTRMFVAEESCRRRPVIGRSLSRFQIGIGAGRAGARLRGMAELLAEATSLDVRPATDPLHAVINGAGKMLSVGRRTGFWVD